MYDIIPVLYCSSSLHLTIFLNTAISIVFDSCSVFFNSSGTFMPKKGVLSAAALAALCTITCTADILVLCQQPRPFRGPRLYCMLRIRAASLCACAVYVYTRVFIHTRIWLPSTYGRSLVCSYHDGVQKSSFLLHGPSDIRFLHSAETM